MTRIVPLELGPPVGWPVQYRVSGPDMNEVRDIAFRLAQVVATDARARRINFDWIEPGRQVRIRIDQDQARLLGLSSESIAAVLNKVMSGVPVTQVRDGIYLVDVIMRATDEQRLSLSTLRNLQFPLANGRTVPLGQLATLDFEQEFPLIWRRDGVPTLTIQADVIARRVSGSGGRHARAGSGDARGKPAQVLSHRRGRHGRGERAVAGLGLRGGSADAVHHDHVPDDAASELQPPFSGAERRSDGPDRRRRRAAPVQQAARLRRHPRHIGAARNDRAQRRDPHRPDRGRAGRGQGDLGCG